MRCIFVAAILCLLVLPVQVFSVGLPPGTQIQLQASGQYTDAYNEDQTATPATLTLTVVQVAGAAIEWSAAPDSVVPGTYVYFPLKIVNTGNGMDSFTITGASENGWGTAFIYDDDNDGVHDDDEQWEITSTDTLVSDGYCPCFLRVMIPDDATQADKVTVTAISAYNSAQGTASEQIDVPEPGMRSTKITASANPSSPYLGQNVTISGTLQPAMAKQLTLDLVAPDGTSATSTIQTGDDGSFQSVFSASQIGTYDAQISFDGDDSYIASDKSISISVQDKISTSMDLVCTPANPVPGDSVTITGTLTPAISAAAVDLTCTNPDSSSTIQHLTTSATGTFSWNTTVSAAGTYSFQAAFAGDAMYKLSSKTISVSATKSTSEHTMTIIDGPTINPSAVDSAGSTQCSASAVDSLSDSVTYNWSDGGAGGTFAPSADSQNPVYTAPVNDSGQDLSVTLTCTAACSSDSQVSDSKSAQLTLRTVDLIPPHVVSVTPANGAKGAALDAGIVITFNEAMDHSSAQSAVSVIPALGSPQYMWSADSKVLTISHAGFSYDTDYACSIAAGAQDANANAMTDAYTWAFSTVTAASFDPAQMTVETDKEFVTSRIVLNAPQASTYSALIYVPEGIVISDAVSGNSLACVEAGSDVSSLTSSWDAASRIITVNVDVSNPSTSAEIVKSINLQAPGTAGSAQITINDCPGLALTVEPPLPGDFTDDHAVDITDAAAFVQEWLRWHSDSMPAWDSATDSLFDLAPHTDGAWPNWTAEGDGSIDIQDAAAFIDCWIGSHSSSSTSSVEYAPLINCRYDALSSADGNEIAVVVDDAPGGMFETTIGIPDGARFNPALDGSGNLRNVVRGAGAGGMFFSEYDAAARTIRLTGSLTGLSPYIVAVIHLAQ